jgi:hypothetical protein
MSLMLTLDYDEDIIPSVFFTSNSKAMELL